jgi:hypothetical protein
MALQPLMALAPDRRRLRSPCLLLVSSILIFPGSLRRPSGRYLSILFVLFPLDFYYEISHSESILDPLPSTLII